jgi:hypothetical protein
MRIEPEEISETSLRGQDVWDLKPTNLGKNGVLPNS